MSARQQHIARNTLLVGTFFACAAAANRNIDSIGMARDFGWHLTLLISPFFYRGPLVSRIGLSKQVRQDRSARHP